MTRQKLPQSFRLEFCFTIPRKANTIWPILLITVKYTFQTHVQYSSVGFIYSTAVSNHYGTTQTAKLLFVRKTIPSSHHAPLATCVSCATPPLNYTSHQANIPAYPTLSILSLNRRTTTKNKFSPQISNSKPQRRQEKSRPFDWLRWRKFPWYTKESWR